jgi:hypothetical protein
MTSEVFKDVARKAFVVAFCMIGLGVGTTSAQSDDASTHTGGQVTIITGAQKDTAQVRSTRFR